MDNKKIVKEFIAFICDWIEKGYKNKEYTGFNYNFHNDKMSYLIADKGIEKRIKKQLVKRLGFKVRVEYIILPSQYKYPDGKLNIKLFPTSRGSYVSFMS